MKTPVEALLAVVGVDGWLRVVDGELRMALPANCPKELKDALRLHKPTLLKLLRLSFLAVRSRVLSAIVFFVSDDATKQSLIQAGAKSSRIYTKAELATLVARRTTPEELRLVHEVKQQFNGVVRN